MRNRPEIFIALVGAVGTDLTRFQNILENELRTVEYEPLPIRLSALLKETDKFPKLNSKVQTSEDARINNSMDAGEKLRNHFKNGDAVARLAISKVLDIRRSKNGEPDKPINSGAFIFNSLKHPREIELLRQLYDKSLYVLSIYTPKHQRLSSLAERIAKSYGNFNNSDYEENAELLIVRDAKEVATDFGQNVRETFPSADVFFDMTEGKNLDEQVKRFIEIIFHHPFRTPTVDEYGMFHAESASLRSADLSRQVGAVITSKDGEIIASGCNEVPKSGGGSYWEGSGSTAKDNRDFKLGYDSSAKMKFEIVNEIFEALPKDWLSEEFSKLSTQEKTEQALYSKVAPLKSTRVANILEFGRIVHAEMSAITSAARRGLSIRDATVYCTTFPCHMCARHIIAAGIRRIVYIEPYPKSMTKDLYGQIVQVDNEIGADSDAVKFEPFLGIAPNRFIDFFEMPVRKNSEGRTVEWQPSESLPRAGKTPSYLIEETPIVESLSIISELTSGEG